MAIQGEKINGAKYFFYKNKKGEWIGSLKIQDFWSRTFLPKGTAYKAADTKELMINILKTDKVPLKKANLDNETAEELEKAGIKFTDAVISDDEIIKK